MKILNFITLLTLSISPSIYANTHVLMQTNVGDIEFELYDTQAPISTKNFEQYIQQGFYNGTIFHRTIPNFMIQGGGVTEGLEEKQTNPEIINEANNGLKNSRGSLAMARTSNPNSATSQFFINVADNSFLDYSTQNAGYTVFGRVIKGIDIVDKIANTPTTQYMQYQNLPISTIKILNVQIEEKTAKINNY